MRQFFKFQIEFGEKTHFVPNCLQKINFVLKTNEADFFNDYNDL